MDSDIVYGIKRKCSSLDQIKNAKRARSQSSINITDLSDCTLLCILRFLDATSLYHLSQTCQRFRDLVQDESLWVYVEARHPPNTSDKMEFCWNNVCKRTKHLMIAGVQRSETTLSLEKLFINKTVENLTVLALEYQCVKYCKLSEFPNSLQELSLRHSFIPHHARFFRFAQETMSNLRTLLLDHCQWFEAGNLISISRYPALEILSLYMCKKLGDDDIGSINLAGKYGFKNLKVIDLRFTGLGDLFVNTFLKPPLQVVYMQNYLTTYHRERLERKLDILNGEKIRLGGYLSDDQDNDSSKESLQARFNTRNVVTTSFDTISDRSISVFKSLVATRSQVTRPASFLYIYPYNECTCGFFDKTTGTYGPVRNDVRENFENSSGSSNSDSSDSDDAWDPKRLRRHLKVAKKKAAGRNIYFFQPAVQKVCSNIANIYDLCTLPAWCQLLSTPDKCENKWLYVREPRTDFEISMLEHTNKHFAARNSQNMLILNDSSQHAQCVCGNMCRGHEQNFIILSRDENGHMTQVNQHSSRPSNSPNTSRKGPSVDDVISVMNKLSNIITKIANGVIDKSVIATQVLATLDNCFEAKELQTFTDDTLFAKDLQTVFVELSKIPQSRLDRILSDHFSCFVDLLKQLFMENNLVTKKRHIDLFFKNLCTVECTKNSTSSSNTSLPGPSGVHKSKKTRKLRKGRKSDDDLDEDKIFSRNNTIFFDTSRPECVTVYCGPRSFRPCRIQIPNHHAVPEQQESIPSNLNELSLRGYHLTDASLSYLKELDLNLLDVTGADLTFGAVKEFMLSNPQCQLIHKFACVCRPKLHF